MESSVNVRTWRDDPCVCSLSKGELADREKWLSTFTPGVEAVSDLADGFELQFPGSREWASRVFELVEKERSCCSSLAFEIRFEPDAGPILLRVRGPKEASDFLKSRMAPVKVGK
jgi:hypothetical protein